jgi:hypothetical protein
MCHRARAGQRRVLAMLAVLGAARGAVRAAARGSGARLPCAARGGRAFARAMGGRMPPAGAPSSGYFSDSGTSPNRSARCVKAVADHGRAREITAVLHESPSARAGNLSLWLGVCQTGRTSVRRRSPEGPGCYPGPSSFQRAAWARLLLARLVRVNFATARARPRRQDVGGRNLRIGEAINRTGLRTMAFAWRSRYSAFAASCCAAAAGAASCAAFLAALGVGEELHHVPEMRGCGQK